MANSTISYLWRDKSAPQGFRTGVSLHSHTNQSQETLDFLANFGNQYPVMRPLLSRLEGRSEAVHGVRVNYAASYWTPPMTPKLAFDLESRQIEKLDLASMVSITDHDNIKAPMLLRTVPSARQIPVSVEWSAPYGIQSFHLGIHNLPSARATEWMATLADYTANPNDRARLTEILAALNDEPNVLVVFNHPLWDLYLVGAKNTSSWSTSSSRKTAHTSTPSSSTASATGTKTAPSADWPSSGTCFSSPAATATASSPTPTSTSPTPHLHRVRPRNPPRKEERHRSSCRSTPSPGSTASSSPPSTPSATTLSFPRAPAPGTSASIILTPTASSGLSASCGPTAEPPAPWPGSSPRSN